MKTIKKLEFNKGKIVVIIGLILIVTGISIIGWVLFARFSTEAKQRDMIKNFQETLKQVDSSEAGDNSATKSSSKEVKSGTIGIMTIPKIDLTVAISEGIDLETLKYAVGHFPGTGNAGEAGNFCVAGHRSYTYSEYFNRLDEIVVGDLITVQSKKGTFTYKVYEKKVVEPSEVSVLDPTKDAEITLVTCTPIRIATQRLIIKGRLQ